MDLFAAINPLLVVSGFVVGMLVGLTGVGGGSLMTPILVLLFGLPRRREPSGLHGSRDRRLGPGRALVPPGPRCASGLRIVRVNGSPTRSAFQHGPPLGAVDSIREF